MSMGEGPDTFVKLLLCEEDAEDTMRLSPTRQAMIMVLAPCALWTTNRVVAVLVLCVLACNDLRLSLLALSLLCFLWRLHHY